MKAVQRCYDALLEDIALGKEKRSTLSDRYDRGYGRFLHNVNVANKGELRVVLDLTKDELPQTEKELTQIVKDATLGVNTSAEMEYLNK